MVAGYDIAIERADHLQALGRLGAIADDIAETDDLIDLFVADGREDGIQCFGIAMDVAEECVAHLVAFAWDRPLSDILALEECQTEEQTACTVERRVKHSQAKIAYGPGVARQLDAIVEVVKGQSGKDDQTHQPTAG